ncbi:iron reductase domain protein, partial [Polychaeton citri CBS 116435]
DGVLTYALFADKDSSTISFHLSAPAAYGWTAVGFGSQMKDALIFIAYPSGDKSGVTVSPRTADGHSEPSYLDKITCKPPGSTDGLAPGANTVSGDDQILSADVVCSGLDAWSGWKSLDFGSENSQFIFALGPDYGSHGPGSSHDKGGSWWASTSLSAGLQRHDQYGHFALSLKAASAGDVSAVPAPNAAGGSSYTGTAASDATGVKSDRDPAPIIHGLIMSLVWVIIFPVGAAVLKIMRKVLWHAACQGIGAVLFLMATAGGIKVSSLYNRSKHFSSPHQVIGILLLIAVILQFALGLVHHRLYKKNQQPTLMGKIHRYLGPVTMVIGLINGFIGF